MAEQQTPDPAGILKLFQLTQSIRRDVYPAVDAKNPDLSAKGKSVLITGGGRGIGKGIAIAWATAGASAIVITGRNEHTLQSTAEELRKLAPTTKVLAFPCDVTIQQSVANLFFKVKSELENLDVLICNVGGPTDPSLSLKVGEAKPEFWMADQDVNFKGTYLPIYYYLSSFNTMNPTGTVISISSGAVATTFPGASAYAIAKMSATRLIEFLHAEYPSIRAFSLHPGIVLSRSFDDYPPNFLPMAKDTMELVGGETLYLSTKKAEHLRGGWLSVNWDVEEMEEHKEEIVEKALLKTKFLGAELGPKGHPWRQ